MSAQTAWNFAPLLERFNQRTHEVQNGQSNETQAEAAAEQSPPEAPDLVQEALDEKRRVEAQGPVEYQKPSALARSLEQCRTLALEFEGTSLKSRAALYKALERAFAFSFECEGDATGFEALCEAHGIKKQARAPYTPIVKLVFGTKYDKSRISEYAGCLSYAKRNKQTPESFRSFIEGQSGGVKGCAAAERAETRKQKPKARGASETIKSALRGAPALATVEGPFKGQDEFVLLLGRRTEGQSGKLEVITQLDAKDAPFERIIKKAGQKFAPAKSGTKKTAAKEVQNSQSDGETRAEVSLSGRDEEHFKVAKSLAGPFDEARFAARYRLLFPQGDLSSLTPAVYCIDDQQQDGTRSGTVKFLQRIDDTTYKFIGLQE